MDDPVESSFRDFAASSAAGLRRFAYLLCGDWHFAEDLTQTTLLKVYRSWRRLQGLLEVSPKQRAVLVLRYFDELTVAETAAVPGCSEGNVKSHDDAPAPVAAPPATATVTVPASPSRVPNQREQELVDYERTHLPRVLTGVKIESVTGSGAIEGDPVLGVRVKVEGHENALELVVTSRDHSETVDDACRSWTCHERRTLPDGNVTVIANWGADTLSVAHFRTDGSIIEVNRWRQDATAWAGVPESAFLQLATDPNLSFQPS